MNKTEIFSIWAPDNSIWSRWAKPVLFAHLNAVQDEATPEAGIDDASWAPAASTKVALILDLSGAHGVWMSLALAGRGYRPVPLYNAVPLPANEWTTPPSIQNHIVAVNVLPIMRALQTAAERLTNIPLPADAPPVFLLDANRRGSGRLLVPGNFDNRSISFASDFPSADFFAAQGIKRVLLVQNSRREPQGDLALTLRSWQKSGVALERMRLLVAESPERFRVSRLSYIWAGLQKITAFAQLIRARDGGYGGWVPPPASG